MNPNKADFVICYSNEASVKKCVECIKNLNVPNGMEIDIITISEVDSVVEAYNVIMRGSDSKYRFYVQENVYITNPDFIFECLKEFADPKVGMVGIVGAKKDDNIWDIGGIDICNEYRNERIILNQEAMCVKSVCRLLLVTQYDIEWGKNEDFFDVEHSIEMRKHGYSVRVIGQQTPWAIYELGASKLERLDVYTTDLGCCYVPDNVKKRQPLVSVVMPVYQGADFISCTIDSILNQTYANMEIIIVDDCSKDESRSVIELYVQKDQRIKSVHLNENVNVCIASNVAYKETHGEYIAIVGHDDIWHPLKIEQQVNFMEVHQNNNVVFTLCDIIDENGDIVSDTFGKNYYDLFNQRNRPKEEWINRLYFGGNCLCAPSALIRKSSLSERLYYPAYIQLQDYALWLDLLIGGDIYIMQERLTYYRHFFNRDNLSTMDMNRENRFCHENAAIKYEYVRKLNCVKIKELFRGHLKDKSVSDDLKLECEKLFILAEDRNPMYFIRLMEILNDEMLRNTMGLVYGIKTTDLYKRNTESLMIDNTPLYTINELHRIIEKYEEIVAKLLNRK